MQRHFMKSKMGWDEKKISSEMFREPTAWYLIAEESEGGNFVGFSHFRFDMDCSCDEVLYVYDLQIESAFQGKGLGNFMMTSLETIGEYVSVCRNKRFMLDDMTKRNALKFSVSQEIENQNCFFVFHKSTAILEVFLFVWSSSSTNF